MNNLQANLVTKYHSLIDLAGTLQKKVVYIVLPVFRYSKSLL